MTLTDPEAIPQFAWPPRIVGVEFAECEQDSLAEIQASASLLCDVRPRQLVWARQTGTPSPLGHQDRSVAAAAITAALQAQEPREAIVATVVETPAGRRTFLRLENA